MDDKFVSPVFNDNFRILQEKFGLTIKKMKSVD
jgi:alpha-tubulin suppressor-like RCC1 family protein